MVAAFFTSVLFLVPVITIISGQILKQFVFLYHGEKITWKSLLTDGGLPSSHSATMSSLTTTIFFLDGLTTLFYLSFFVTIITAKDAFGVRRESGKHARILKQVLKKLALKDAEHIKMLVGHTKTQVLAGLVWGFIVAIIMHPILISLFV